MIRWNQVCKNLPTYQAHNKHIRNASNSYRNTSREGVLSCSWFFRAQSGDSPLCSLANTHPKNPVLVEILGNLLFNKGKVRSKERTGKLGKAHGSSPLYIHWTTSFLHLKLQKRKAVWCRAKMSLEIDPPPCPCRPLCEHLWWDRSLIYSSAKTFPNVNKWELSVKR